MGLTKYFYRNQQQTMIKNEMERILALSDLNIDFSNQYNFEDLARLAARITGTEVSLVNLIDTYTQWTISNHGLNLKQMPREESVCQYTIAEGTQFEVEDLSKDERFSDKFYVTDDPNLRYYFGIPLNLSGQNIGALCVLDKTKKNLSPEKIELLQIIADEIVNRLKALKVIDALKHRVEETKSTQNKVVHDIRGPLSGIVGLAEYMAAQGQNNKIADVLEMVNLIHKSGNSILELADEILSAETKKAQAENDGLTLLSFKEKLHQLYTPQARSKNILLKITTSTDTEHAIFSKSKLLQITGNLISNAIKFTPTNGEIVVHLGLKIVDDKSQLSICVRDNGIGIDDETITQILSQSQTTTSGTEGEKGYGFGLQLVQHIVNSLNGELEISRVTESSGSEFKVTLNIS